MAAGVRFCVPLIVVGILPVVTPAAAATRAPQTVSPEGAVYTFSTLASGESLLTMDAADLHVEKTVAADGTSSIIVRAEGDELRLEVKHGRVAVYSSAGNASFAADGSDQEEERGVRVALARSTAVQRFRAAAAQIAARGGRAPFDEAVTLSSALIARLTGDPTAFRGFARRHRGADGRVRPASMRRTVDCWGQYEMYISWAWDQYMTCLASRRYSLINGLTYCEFQYYMRAESAWFQFLSCSAFPIV